MELALKIISNDQAIGTNTVQDIKDFNSQYSAKQAKKREQKVSMLPANKKAFHLMADDRVELSTINKSLNY